MCVGFMVVTFLFVLGISGLLFGPEIPNSHFFYFFSAILGNGIARICIMKTCRRNGSMAALVIKLGARLR